MSWEISKQIDFCYGHRVWNQKLNKEYSLNVPSACRRKHGHNCALHITLQSDSLENGMVTDFHNLSWMKKFIDDVIDHKFIMDVNDPLLIHELPFLFTNKQLDKSKLITNTELNYSIINLEFHKDLPEYLVENLESFVLVTFVPTSENLAKWLYDIVNEKMKQIGVKTKSVEFYETPKSRSLYIGE